MSASDAELVRSHDARAFGTLYARHAQAVHGWFAARVAWAAADLTAETEKLLSIAAQHPGAPVVRDAATFDAVQRELFAKG